MTEQPIDLTRKEVRELWDFMAKATPILNRVEKMLDNHEQRLLKLEETHAQQRGVWTFVGIFLAIFLAVGGFLVNVFKWLK